MNTEELAAPRQDQMPHKILPRVGYGKACGKAIIVGEHAVVYGAHAVAMPLPQIGINLEVKPHSEDMNSVYYLKLGHQNVADHVSAIIPDAFKLIGKKLYGLTIQGHSSIPMGAGLGSSATLCIAALRGILDSCGQSLSRAEIAEIGNHMERRFHGNPSGLDTAVIAFEECVYYSRHDKTEPIKIKNDKAHHKWHFALIDSKIRASTMSMIKLAEPFFRSPLGDRRIEKFDALSKLVHTALMNHDCSSVAQAMDETCHLLTEAGVVPDDVSKILNECRRQGIMAAKTTGAGGGGTIICLLDPDLYLEQYKKLQEHFLDFPIFHISF